MSDHELTEADLEVGARIKWTESNNLLGSEQTVSGEIVDRYHQTTHHVDKEDTESLRVVIDTGDDQMDVPASPLLDEHDRVDGSHSIESFMPAEEA